MISFISIFWHRSLIWWWSQPWNGLFSPFFWPNWRHGSFFVSIDPTTVLRRCSIDISWSVLFYWYPWVSHVSPSSNWFLIVRHPYQLSGLSQSCIYIFLVCSLLELLGILWVVPYLRRLKLIEEQRAESTVGEARVDLRRVFCLAKEERSLMTVAMLFLLVASGIEIVDILLLGRVIGYAVEQETMHLANITVLIVFGIDLISSICTFLYSWIFDLAGQYVIDTSLQRRNQSNLCVRWPRLGGWFVVFVEEYLLPLFNKRFRSSTRAVLASWPIDCPAMHK